MKNLRATKEGRLQLGRKVETFRAEEIADADKTPMLRLYLKKWAWEVGTFFGGDVDKNSPTRSSTTSPPASPSSESTPSDHPLVRAGWSRRGAAVGKGQAVWEMTILPKPPPLA